MINDIACFYFPTTLLVIDDDQDFLKNFKYGLSGKYHCICTSDMTKAHDILNKNRQWTNSLLKEGISRIYPNEVNAPFSVSMDVLSLKKQVYNPNRFKHIAIAIIDYDMPEKNGLEFIRSLIDPQIKIILLTGKAKQETIIKAFNDREIHRYISKGDSDYLQKICQYVCELQIEFFVDSSKFILDSMEKGENEIFENKSFIDLFNKTIHENQIVEYYLLDESGSFLMLDAAAQNQVWFIIKSKENMQHFYELAKDDPQTPADIVKKLKNCTILTHFKTREEDVNPAASWNFVTAQPLDSEKEYYYAIIKNHEHFSMDFAQIKSYREFLNNQPDER